MRKIVFSAAALLTIGIFFLYCQKRATRNPEGLAAGSPESRMSRSWDGQQRTDMPVAVSIVENSTADSPTAVAALICDGLDVGGESLRLVEEAVRFAAFVEQEKRQFPERCPAFRILEGAQRRLFLDDFAYAALRGGEIDCDQALAAFSNAVERIAALDAADLNQFVIR